MALSTGARAGMTFMARTVIDHLEPKGTQSSCQFVADCRCNVHYRLHSLPQNVCQEFRFLVFYPGNTII